MNLQAALEGYESEAIKNILKKLWYEPQRVWSFFTCSALFETSENMKVISHPLFHALDPDFLPLLKVKNKQFDNDRWQDDNVKIIPNNYSNGDRIIFLFYHHKNLEKDYNLKVDCIFVFQFILQLLHGVT